MDSLVLLGLRIALLVVLWFFVLMALRAMRADLKVTGQASTSSTSVAAPDGLHGANIELPYPSVGATEQVLLTAVRAQGITELTNAAVEPEIEDLGGGRYRVPARASLSEVGELFDLDIDDDDIDSVGGLLAKTTGRVPIPGSTATALGLDLEAERTAGRRKRLSTVLVSRAADDEDEDRDQEDHHER